MTEFSTEVVTAVLAHMNDDHTDDNLIIVRGHGHLDADSAVMVDLDASAGVWQVVTDGREHEVRIAWPTEAKERADLRKGIVELYEVARQRLHL